MTDTTVSTSLIFGAGAGLLAYRFHLLTRSGAVAAAGLGALIYGAGGWAWTLPMLAFFLPSSLLSLVRNRLRPASREFAEKGSRRDAWQVLANGGPGGVLALLWLASGNDLCFLAYLGSLAAVSADTWGTEIGMFSPTSPRMISSWRVVEAGSSGGITPLGLAAGVAGSALIACTGFVWIGGDRTTAALAVTLAGVGGSLVDSLTGATLQVQYRCASCGSVTERRLHCERETTLSTGFRFVSNDLVNVICAVAGAGLAFFLGSREGGTGP